MHTHTGVFSERLHFVAIRKNDKLWSSLLGKQVPIKGIWRIRSSAGHVFVFEMSKGKITAALNWITGDERQKKLSK